MSSFCCIGERLNNFEVLVGDNRENPTGVWCAFHEDPVALSATITITCDQPVTGQYVYIKKTGSDPILTLCEVRIFGTGRFQRLYSIKNLKHSPEHWITCKIRCHS